jgi:hypothetical protein
VNNSISYAVTVKASTGLAVGLGVGMVAACGVALQTLRAPAMR